jgi:hypothetical protein
MSTRPVNIQPTFNGHVITTYDALLLFEACLTGHLALIPGRPSNQERKSLACSGSVFIYEEISSGIKRWTDGQNWSPSRRLGNFLIYRELANAFPPGEKRKAKKKSARNTARTEPYAQPDRIGESYSPITSQSTSFTGVATSSYTERQLAGSLVESFDSYDYEPNGLMKRTLSIKGQGATYHLISYYNKNDVLREQFSTPSKMPAFSNIRPRVELMSNKRLRFPIEEIDETLTSENYLLNSNFHPTHPQPSQKLVLSAGYQIRPEMVAPHILPRLDDSLNSNIPTISDLRSISLTSTSGPGYSDGSSLKNLELRYPNQHSYNRELHDWR